MTQMISSYLIHEVSLNQSASEITKLEDLLLKVKKSVTLKEKKNLWNEAIVYYQIDEIFNGTERRLIKQGMRMWEESSCIQFVQRNSSIHRDYVAITKSECGCCYKENYQGRRNKGRSELSLADGCEAIEIILHELGHVLGFYHEHQHPDRDQWVQINERNIDQGYESEFWRLSRVHVDTLGLPYDYQSVMHYPNDAYAYYSFWATIVPKQAINGTVPNIGNQKNLSQGDVKATNLLYKCPTCGGVFYGVVGFIETPVSSNDSDSNLEYCQWRIVASKGERIILDVSTTNIFVSHNCASDFLEIRNGHSDKSPLLGRYCGTNKEGTLYLVGGDNMLVTYLKTTKINGNNGFSVFFRKKCGTSPTLVNVNNPVALESPNYPFNYRAYDNCEWTYEAPENHTIDQ
ncbi:Similar to tld: Dorsal-ventral patterning protein tolloid (Drosophila melanogaster) [Cotesia congregata]|uniref:Metalloendopeptidase n=1 Tax=Cotesia congregata TaxID=51543 RepID=A0A8J2HBZ4_COTCN|nr:Similar to tld: Dorsal-ventral patterning protein tolloid (Drosophila melanogaster) [Cotesia congregata]